MSTSADRTAASAHALAELAVDIDTDTVADANDLRETGSVDDIAGERTELPLEADPADVVEQDAAVPYDDEER